VKSVNLWNLKNCHKKGPEKALKKPGERYKNTPGDGLHNLIRIWEKK